MSRVRPLWTVGLGALVGLGAAYPVAHQYTAAGAGSSVTVTSGAPARNGAGEVVGPRPGGGGPTRSPSSPAAPARKTLRATGPTVQTQYGPVQVRVTVVATGSSDRIRSVTAVRLPSGGRSGEISAFAGPQLNQEARAAQSARVDTVSGASYTSDGYRSSLQAALVAVRNAERGTAGG